MAEHALTRDNPLLSRPIIPAESPSRFSADVCKVSREPGVSEYVRLSLAENTRRAYRADLAHFEAWGGSIPATPETLAKYLADHAHVLSTATLARRIASIAKAHVALDTP